MTRAASRIGMESAGTPVDGLRGLHEVCRRLNLAIGGSLGFGRVEGPDANIPRRPARDGNSLTKGCNPSPDRIVNDAHTASFGP